MNLVKLSSLGTLKNGMNFSKEASTSGCKIIGVADFGNRVFPDYSSLDEIDASIVGEECLLKNGDILFVRSNGNKNLVGRSMFIKDLEEPVCYSGFCISFRPNTDLVVPEYLFYALRSPFCRKQYSYSLQTNITNLSQGVLGSVEVPLPSYEEQKRVAKILFDLDTNIQLNQSISEKLEQTAKLIYDYWFVQFDFPNAEGKPYKSSGGEMVWCEELKRDIPKGWSVAKVENVLSKVPQTKRYKTNEYLPNGKYPIIDQSDKYICGYVDSSEDLIDVGDCVVFGDHTKYIKYVNFPFARGADGTQILISSMDCLPNYLLYLQIKNLNLVSQGYSRYFKFLKEKYIVLPTKVVSDNYMEIVASVLTKVTASVFENKELATFRDWLLPLLMNGQATID